MSEHLNILTNHYDLNGKSVCDIGAGDGAFASSLAQLGAVVTAIEVDEDHLTVIKQTHGDNIAALLGTAENLPLPDHSQDLVCMMFSLHHIPLDHQKTAISEIKRVLRSNGRLHVAEPRPYGDLTKVLVHVDDETEVRTVSQKRMDDLPEQGEFCLVSKDEYTLTRTFTDFNQLVTKLVMNDPARKKRLPHVRYKMEETFSQLARQADNIWCLDQPCVSYHFEKSD